MNPYEKNSFKLFMITFKKLLNSRLGDALIATLILFIAILSVRIFLGYVNDSYLRNGLISNQETIIPFWADSSKKFIDPDDLEERENNKKGFTCVGINGYRKIYVKTEFLHNDKVLNIMNNKVEKE